MLFFFQVVLDTNQWYHATYIHPGEISITIGSEYDWLTMEISGNWISFLFKVPNDIDSRK